MKKLLTLLFVLILSFSVMLTLTACLGGGNDGVGDNTADGGADTGGNGGGENNGTDNGGNGGENNGTDNGGQGGGENNGSNNGNGTPDAGEGEGDNNSGEGGNADGEESYFNEDGELILYKDGTPTFRFVVGSGVGSVGAELGNIISDLNALSKTNVKQVTTAEGPVPVEILIGTVNNRGKEYKINKYELGAEGYIVKQIGTKIVVIGGSDTALAAAVAYLKTSVFGLSDDSESFSDLVMTTETNREYIQDNYLITSLTVGTASIEDCKIYYDVQSSKAKTIATNLRDDLYIKLGVYIDLVKDVKKHDGTSPAIIIKALENDGVGGGFYIDVTNSILTIECEFDGLFESLTNSFLNSNIFDLTGAVTVANGFSYTPDFRNITYEQYGAVGDGVTDDFFAIKAAHDDANANKLIVHASPNATYYIGNANGSISIEVKTSTYWHGCSFIFDDETVAYDSPGRKTSIFDVVPSSTKKEYSVTTSPIASISSGATNVGFAPGYEALIIFENSNQRRYHRHGANEDDGQIQTELVIVDAEGNIHTSTPVQWTYDVITRLIVYRTDDAPIEIKGEDESGKRTVITTLYNDGPSA